MNFQKVIECIKKDYPVKNIILNNEDNPTEIICEIDPTKLHPDYSIAIAVIDKSKPHFHRKTTETYQVIKGRLDLYINNKKFKLIKGENKIIYPNEIHYAVGNETWIKVTSNPGWKLNDQYLI